MFLHDEILKGFDEGLMTGMILIDLHKALDMIDHDLLLKKLSTIGFSNHTAGWFKSYLSNKLFCVNLENCYSDPSILQVRYRKGPFWDLTVSHIHE